MKTSIISLDPVVVEKTITPKRIVVQLKKSEARDILGDLEIASSLSPNTEKFINLLSNRINA